MRNIEEIKRIPIVSYLERKGITIPTRGNISAYWRGDKNPSVSIDRIGNRWYDQVPHGGSEVYAFENTAFRSAIQPPYCIGLEHQVQ